MIGGNDGQETTENTRLRDKDSELCPGEPAQLGNSCGWHETLSHGS